MNDTVMKLMGMVDRYWDLAYAEGSEGRTHDTEAGDAGATRQAIEAELTRLFTPLSQTEVVDGFCKQLHDVQLVGVFNAGARFAESMHGITGESK